MNLDLGSVAMEIRKEVVCRSHIAKTSHLGSSLSVVDILVALYFGCCDSEKIKFSSPDRDKIILSKGHAALAQYVTLGKLGILSPAQLERFGQPGALLEEHPNPSINGIEAATGSLGHGLSIGAGIALANQRSGRTSHTYVILSDGECNEGSVWEAAMFSAANNLGSLCVFIDFNKWQATGRSTEVMRLNNLAGMWKSFGWDSIEVDGHNLDELVRVNKARSLEKPSAFICHTIKGKGVSFMEDDNNWHYRVPDHNEMEAALVELSSAK